MSSVIVGHRIFKKPFTELYIGSSVVAGNADSVRDRETREKGQPVERTVYLPVDNLDLIEVYKGFLVSSNVAENAVYEILYDALEREVKGILCGVREEGGISYYAPVKKGMKSVKKQIAFYIDYVDFGLLPALQKEIEETLNFKEEKIKEVFGNPPEKIYAGTFVGSTKDGLMLLPFSTYKPKEVIPAYTGEENEDIERLEAQIEEINSKLSHLDRESDDYRKLSEKKAELIRELVKQRNRFYNPDILKAVKSKGEKLFITQKPEIRYLGENLIQAAYEYKALSLGEIRKIKGVYSVITLPVYNNLSKQLQKSYLELFLCLYADGEIYPVELQKARQTVSAMEEVLREFIKSLEAETKPNLTNLKERIKDNLSLKKRIEDIEKFVISKLGGEPEEVEETLNFLRNLKEELERARRILYSPFTVNKLVSAYEIASLLQEAGLDLQKLGKEGWNRLYEVAELVNENLENSFKNEFTEEIKALIRFFLKRIEENKPLHYKIMVKGKLEEGFYPSQNIPLDIVDLYPNRILVNIIKSALKRLNALEKLQKLEDNEVFFEDVSAKLGYYAVVTFARKVFSAVAKNYLNSLHFNKEGEIKALKELLIQNWLGEYRKPTEHSKEEGEIVDIEGLEDLLEG